MPLERDINIAVNGCSGFITSTQKGPFMPMLISRCGGTCLTETRLPLTSVRKEQHAGKKMESQHQQFGVKRDYKEIKHYLPQERTQNPRTSSWRTSSRPQFPSSPPSAWTRPAWSSPSSALACPDKIQLVWKMNLRISQHSYFDDMNMHLCHNTNF